jgi:hypothetical protein
VQTSSVLYYVCGISLWVLIVFSLHQSVLLFFGGVLCVFLKPSSECCMWDQFVGVVGGVGSTVFFV